MMKIREAMFQLLFPHADVKRQDDCELIDKILSLKVGNSRLTVVKDCEMPCMFDGKGKEKGAIQYRREMGANIVEEVRNE